MTDDQTTAAVRKHIEAFNDGDLDSLLTGFAEDALWITGQTTVRGHDALRTFFAAAIDALRPNLAVENLLVQDSRAACQITETLSLGQEQRSYSIAAFFQLHDGLITAAKVYREGSAEVA